MNRNLNQISLRTILSTAMNWNWWFN